MVAHSLEALGVSAGPGDQLRRSLLEVIAKPEKAFRFSLGSDEQRRAARFSSDEEARAVA